MNTVTPKHGSRMFVLLPLIYAALFLAHSALNAQTLVYSWSASDYFLTKQGNGYSFTWVSGSSAPLDCTCVGTNSTVFYGMVGEWPVNVPALKSGSTFFATITLSVNTATQPESFFYIYARNTAGAPTGNQYDIWQEWLGDSSTTIRTITVPLDLSTTITGTAGQWSVNMGMEGPGSLDIYSYNIYEGSNYLTTPPVLNGTATATTGTMTAATGYTPFTISPPGTTGTGAPITLGTNTFIPNSSAAAAANATALSNAIALCQSSSSNYLTVTTSGTYWLSGSSTLNLSGTDLTINGKGSVFIFTGTNSFGVAIQSSNSMRMVVENLTFDWDWTYKPIASLGTVANLVTTASNTNCDFVFTDLNSTQVALVKKTTWSSMFPMDPNTLVKTTNNGVISIPGGTAITTGSAGSNSLHAYFDNTVQPLVNGSTYCIRHMYYNMTLFKMVSCNDILFNNVNIYSFPGVGWLWEADSFNWEYLGCNIQRAPGSTHPLTTAADGIHSNEGQGNIIIENCTFSGEGDDSINIHDGCYETNLVTSATNNNLLTLTDYTALNRTPRLNTGDMLEFYSGDYSYLNGSSSPVLSGSITSFSADGSSENITFSSAVPSPLSAYAILRNTRYHTSNVLIENCNFINTNGDAILLSASGATVQNCNFQNVCGSGIELETNLVPGLWCEGNGATNVLVQKNSFINVCNTMSSQFAGASLVACPRNSAGTSLPWGTTTTFLYNTITIEKNTFENCAGPAMNLTNCNNVIAKSNQITCTEAMPYTTRYSGAILTQLSSNLALGGNTWINAIPATYAYGVVSDTTTTTNVVTGTNTLTAYIVSGVTAASGSGQVALTWTSAPGVVSYNVKRATVSGGPYTTIASTTGGSYSDSSGVNGTIYYYVVTAVTASGTTTNSAEVNGVINPAPFQLWEQTYFGTLNPNSPVASSTANPAGDGIPNLMKYAESLNPTLPAIGPFLAAAQTGGFATLAFNRVGSATDITYHVQASSDLAAWSEIWNSSTVPYAGGTNAVASVTVPDNIQISAAPGKRRFLRLQITQP